MTDRFRYSRDPQFVYQFALPHRPRSFQAKAKGRNSSYVEAIRAAARDEITHPIESNDVEIEITWTSVERQGTRSDLDNIIKPIIDALIGIGFADDSQVRTVVATYFDRTRSHRVDGYVEDLNATFLSRSDDVIQVTLYSDTRLAELGDAKVVRQRYLRRKLPEDPNP